MKIKLLHILMILIVLQSTVVVADIHQLHQSGKEHLKFDHLEQTHDASVTEYVDDAQNEAFENVNLDSINSYDCQHCCHCHGVACHYLVNMQHTSFLIFNTSKQFTQITQYQTRDISPDLRPPIV